MAPVLNTLKDLHEVQTELADARADLARCPLMLKSKEADLAKRQSKNEADRERSKRLRMDIDEKELTLKTGEQKVNDLKVKLNQAKSNKEYETLQEEIKHFSQQNDELEEAILVIISDEEELSQSLEEAEGQVREAADELDKFRETINYKIEKLTGRIAALEAKASEHEQDLDSDTRAAYKRLAKTKGDHESLAACIDRICQSCHTTQTAQQWDDLILGRVVICYTCGAMLYKV